MRIRRGEVYYIDSGYMTTGSEQRAGRPAIVVSNDMNNEFSSTIQVVYLTTQPKTDLPTHVLISSIKRESIALCEQITAVAVERIGDYCGEVTDSEMAKIESAMLASLGIQDLPEPKEETPPTPESRPADADLALRCATAEAKCAMLQGMYDSLLGRLMKTK